MKIGKIHWFCWVCLQTQINQWGFTEFSQSSVLYFSKLSFSIFDQSVQLMNPGNSEVQNQILTFWEIITSKMVKSIISLSNDRYYDETDDIYTTPKRKNIPKISRSPSDLCKTPGYGVHSRCTQVSPDSGFELTPSPSSYNKEFKPSSVK